MSVIPRSGVVHFHVLCVCSAQAATGFLARGASGHGAGGKAFMVISGVSAKEEMCLVVENGAALISASIIHVRFLISRRRQSRQQRRFACA